MGKLLRTALLLLLAAFLLGGCGRLAVARPDPARAQEDFANRLRWADLAGAAHYLEPENRDDFRRRFAALKGLHITEVRLTAAGAVTPRRLESSLAVDYYRLPSLTIHTSHLHLVWEYVDLGRWQPGYWQIVGPFPEFP